MRVLGKRIKIARTKKGLTQETLAKQLGVARATVASWETGRRDPDTDILKKISEICETSVDWLLGKTDEKYKPPYQKDECDEVNELLEHLHKRPELKVLFSTTKNAKKEDIEKAVSYIEFLKKQSEGDWDE